MMYEEALAAYDECLRIDPKYVDAWNNKGIALKDLRRYEEALAAYDECLRIDPGHLLARSNRDITLRRLKNK